MSIKKNPDAKYTNQIPKDPLGEVPLALKIKFRVLFPDIDPISGRLIFDSFFEDSNEGIDYLGMTKGVLSGLYMWLLSLKKDDDDDDGGGIEVLLKFLERIIRVLNNPNYIRKQ